jgi:hypothetical protein
MIALLIAVGVSLALLTLGVVALLFTVARMQLWSRFWFGGGWFARVELSRSAETQRLPLQLMPCRALSGSIGIKKEGTRRGDQFPVRFRSSSCVKARDVDLITRRESLPTVIKSRAAALQRRRR